MTASLLKLLLTSTHLLCLRPGSREISAWAELQHEPLCSCHALRTYMKHSSIYCDNKCNWVRITRSRTYVYTTPSFSYANRYINQRTPGEIRARSITMIIPLVAASFATSKLSAASLADEYDYVVVGSGPGGDSLA